MKPPKPGFVFLAAVLLAACCAVPLVFDPSTSYLVYFLFMSFIYVALAQMWNLIAGYTGQITLGLHAFFGLGAYIVAILWSRHLVGYLDPLGMAAAGCGAAILAALIGIPLLSKLRGDYFALGTLGLGEILRLATIQGRDLTGGPVGIMLPSGSFTTIAPHYYVALFVAVLAIGVTFFMTRSRIGLALIAVRDVEPAASASGINILKFKVLVFAVGAFVVGLCGALQAYYIFHVEPQGFYSLDWTLYPVLMCILGGTGTITGPIVGAIFLNALFEVAKYFLPEIHPVFSGLLIILAIIFLPTGVIGVRLRRVLGIKKGTAKDT